MRAFAINVGNRNSKISLKSKSLHLLLSRSLFRPRRFR